MPTYPDVKVTIVGGGIVGAFEAYFAWLDAKRAGNKVRVTIHEKGASVADTTTSNIFPSLTVDEILSVVPRGSLLLEKLGLLFNEPGGIRVDDVPGINGSDVANKFIDAVVAYSANQTHYTELTRALLNLGHHSMQLWQKIYENGDDELKQILIESNFKPCHDTTGEDANLHDGYRIDLIYDVPDATARAESMRADYAGLGYQKCRVLTPKEVSDLDPSLKSYCEKNSALNADGVLVWKKGRTALFRPGGCIDTNVFLPKFYAYLEKVMGKYINEDGREKKCFKLKFNHDVDGILYDGNDESKIVGLQYNQSEIKFDKHEYNSTEYVFAPGAAVGTLDKLGFIEPAYAGFAGPSLRLVIPIPSDKLEEYADFNQRMEVHKEGVVLAWQARFMHIDGKPVISIGVAGTKAFYADQKPHIDHAFAIDRNLLQLQMINDVLPQFVSLALGRSTQDQIMTADDLEQLVAAGIAKRWVGTRAVAFDGSPTLGSIYKQSDGSEVANAHATTHLGSGGASFAPAAVDASRAAIGAPSASMMFRNMPHEEHKSLLEKTLTDMFVFSSSKRKP